MTQPVFWTGDGQGQLRGDGPTHGLEKKFVGVGLRDNVATLEARDLGFPLLRLGVAIEIAQEEIAFATRAIGEANRRSFALPG